MASGYHTDATLSTVRAQVAALSYPGRRSPAADGDQPRRALETIPTQRGERDVRKHGDPSPMIAARS
jgi:hypothetical protein